MIILFIGIFTSRFMAINYVSENDESSYHMENGVQVVESQLASGKYPSIKVKKRCSCKVDYKCPWWQYKRL